MASSGEAGRFVRGFVVPFLLLLGGVGLVAIERVIDVAAVGFAGYGMAGVGLLWIVLSCVRNGIDIFDL